VCDSVDKALIHALRV